MPDTVNKLKEYRGSVSICMVVIAMAHSLKRIKRLNNLMYAMVLSEVTLNCLVARSMSHYVSQGPTEFLVHKRLSEMFIALN